MSYITNFQKIQKISGIIPVVSTVFVAIVTILELMRRKVSVKIWFLFALGLLVEGISVYCIYALIFPDQYPILKLLAVLFISVTTNNRLVDLQIIAKGTR